MSLTWKAHKQLVSNVQFDKTVHKYEKIQLCSIKNFD